ncbi:uncharacterized protein LOC123514967 isoform X2 [Portunus trituberculatus]|uniref:uncharacterized protein LOC123514967 isoform X2 n=1 Tax=Portunus trituberculatus TaxID=210409 RepID=UPI001E1CDB82|nr:uncharacterized protein LOC123514967 isoform X2 [Portunus trituberculatus]
MGRNNLCCQCSFSCSKREEVKKKIIDLKSSIKGRHAALKHQQEKTGEDEEDLATGDIDVTLPSKPASPRPGPSGIQNLQISSPPEPLSPDTETEGVVEIASEPAPPQADDHQYSQPPQAGRNQRGSSRREGTLAPEMLQVHEDIRNSLSDLTECITTYLPGIATSLNELASRRLV